MRIFLTILAALIAIGIVCLTFSMLILPIAIFIELVKITLPVLLIIICIILFFSIFD